MRLTHFVIIAALLIPAAASAAPSKEMLDLQRQIAELQDQLKNAQRDTNQKIDAMMQLVQQQLDIAGKTNTGVSSLNSGVTQTLQREMQGLKDSVAGIPAMAVKIDNLTNEVSELQSSLADSTSKLNKQSTAVNDILNQIKLMQAPPPPPPGAEGETPGAAGPPPPASTLFQNAVRDQNSGKMDQALQEFTDFLRFYPNDANAISAQFNIAEIHYKTDLDQAVKDFDAVIEGYAEDLKITPDAYYMKGMALKQGKKTAAATATFRELREKYPKSTAATQATTQLRNMGVPLVAPRAAPKTR